KNDNLHDRSNLLTQAPMQSIDRFQDNPNGVITDSENQKGWLPKDSYQDLGRWSNWTDAQHYVQMMRQVYAGGFSDWRLPTREEALSLYDPELRLPDWEGKDIHIHPLFVPKASFYLWTGETN
ncbi:MAG: DUF1566 domain-containing protein, partial [Nitrospinaceae bacterium]|nr:DUF1566 domain-containing protein [Nitrospinaceae bacterium]NIR55519.1 DUF1566 domain-containing protein [Nitrospinaceae bacterium]NIT82799.1 DUF1566 domain-containing protein [Nitrospinaceae bacterium]NIW06584.1 DUF1566 domain-containing protein [Nitrospinaceae bacterium]NIW59748.1 DUF1566 domain-containing protein [Nitrospinaceae bacterium]